MLAHGVAVDGFRQAGQGFEPVEGSPLHFTVRCNSAQKLMPYWQISDQEFTRYPCRKLDRMISKDQTRSRAEIRSTPASNKLSAM
jgi:hypothetical protein